MFDIKLIDGRYFSNVVAWDKSQEDFENDINFILKSSNQMDIIDDLGEELGGTLVENIKSEEIEYICKSYEYKGVK